MTRQPGMIVLFGSGEASPEGQRVHEQVMRRVTPPVRAAILETPAGFELNSAAVAGRLADYLRVHLQNYRPVVEVIAARRKGTAESPDNPEIVGPIARANYVMLGPGSPTYAVRQLRDSLAWYLAIARQRLGHPLVLASAAAIAVGAHALPVYEIYKVGEDPHWKPGLDLFGPYGARLAIIPHWNNSEGGEGLDTSHCFLGGPRFAALQARLPDDTTVVGIDERTALIVDFAEGVLRVIGSGGVTLVRAGAETRLAAKERAPLGALGITRQPETGEGLPRAAVEQARRGDELASVPESGAPAEINALVQARADARARRDWATADRLRAELAARGWQVQDEASGSRVTPRAGDRGEEIVETERLGQVGGRADLAREVGGIAGPGHRDDRDGEFGAPVSADQAAAVDAREATIEEHEVDVFLYELFQGLERAVRFDDRVANLFQVGPNPSAELGVVVDHQHPPAISR